MNKKNIALIVIVIIAIASFITISYIITKKQAGIIESVIDGDTIKVKFANDKIEVIRLLSINAPEKSQPYYDESRNYLNVLKGKEVILEKRDKDKYGRILAYVFYNNRLINEELLRQGLAHTYFFDEAKYEDILEKAEMEARLGNRGVWKRSIKKQDKCIDIVKEENTLRINNICNFPIVLENYSLKDEGREIIILNRNIGETSNILVSINDFDYPNSIFLRNSDGDLAGFYRD